MSADKEAEKRSASDNDGTGAGGGGEFKLPSPPSSGPAAAAPTTVGDRAPPVVGHERSTSLNSFGQSSGQIPVLGDTPSEASFALVGAGDHSNSSSPLKPPGHGPPGASPDHPRQAGITHLLRPPEKRRDQQQVAEGEVPSDQTPAKQQMQKPVLVIDAPPGSDFAAPIPDSSIGREVTKPPSQHERSTSGGLEAPIPYSAQSPEPPRVATFAERKKLEEEEKARKKKAKKDKKKEKESKKQRQVDEANSNMKTEPSKVAVDTDTGTPLSPRPKKEKKDKKEKRSKKEKKSKRDEDSGGNDGQPPPPATAATQERLDRQSSLLSPSSTADMTDLTDGPSSSSDSDDEGWQATKSSINMGNMTVGRSRISTDDPIVAANRSHADGRGRGVELEPLYSTVETAEDGTRLRRSATNDGIPLGPDYSPTSPYASPSRGNQASGLPPTPSRPPPAVRRSSQGGGVTAGGMPGLVPLPEDGATNYQLIPASEAERADEEANDHFQQLLNGYDPNHDRIPDELVDCCPRPKRATAGGGSRQEQQRQSASAVIDDDTRNEASVTVDDSAALAVFGCSCWRPGMPLKIAFVSWNMGLGAAAPTREGFIRPFAHIIAVNTQENGPYVGTNTLQHNWCQLLTTGWLRGEYTKVGVVNQMALHLVVFARTRDVFPFVCNLHCDKVSTGAGGGAFANKGGVAVGLTLSPTPVREFSPSAKKSRHYCANFMQGKNGTIVKALEFNKGAGIPRKRQFSILLVGSHLTAHQHHVTRRNDDYKKIVTSLKVGAAGPFPECIRQPPASRGPSATASRRGNSPLAELEDSDRPPATSTTRPPTATTNKVKSDDATKEVLRAWLTEEIKIAAPARADEYADGSIAKQILLEFHHWRGFHEVCANGEGERDAPSTTEEGEEKTQQQSSLTELQRLENWKTLHVVLFHLGIPLTMSEIEEIVSGDEMSGVRFLLRLKGKSAHLEKARRQHKERQEGRQLGSQKKNWPPAESITARCRLELQEGNGVDLLNAWVQLPLGSSPSSSVDVSDATRFAAGDEVSRLILRSFGDYPIASFDPQALMEIIKTESPMSTDQRLENWETLRKGVLSDLGMTLTDDTINALVHAEDNQEQELREREFLLELKARIGIVFQLHVEEEEEEGGSPTLEENTESKQQQVVPASPEQESAPVIPRGGTSPIIDDDEHNSESSPLIAKEPPPSTIMNATGNAWTRTEEGSADSEIPAPGSAGILDHVATPLFPTEPLAGDNTAGFDVCLFGGDLNYRINGTKDSIQYVIDNIQELQPVLVANDQLTIEQKKGVVFHNFIEGALGFLPTYKYGMDKKTKLRLDHYDQNKKKPRMPAYCDRVLMRQSMNYSNYQIKLEEYVSSSTIRTSDHLPVTAIYSMDTPVPLSRGDLARFFETRGGGKRRAAAASGGGGGDIYSDDEGEEAPTAGGPSKSSKAQQQAAEYGHLLDLDSVDNHGQYSKKGVSPVQNMGCCC